MYICMYVCVVVLYCIVLSIVLYTNPILFMIMKCLVMAKNVT